MREWIEHRFKILFVDFFRHVLPYCSRWLRYFIADSTAFFTYKIAHKKISVMRRELKKLLGTDVSDRRIDEVILQGSRTLRKDLFETWMFPILTRDKIRKMTYFAGRENLDEAMDRGKGAIILLAHFGLRKIILPALGYEGYKVNQIAAKPTNWKIKGKYGVAHKKMMDVEFRCERSLPVNFIYIDESLRDIFRALNNNESIVIAIDGPIGHKRIGVKFLNYTANFSPTAILLALKTGAAVLPTFVVRQKDNRHKIVIERSLGLETEQGREFAVRKAVNEFRDILEKYVLEYPCHYADWLYRAQLWPISENLFIFQ